MQESFAPVHNEKDGTSGKKKNHSWTIAKVDHILVIQTSLQNYKQISMPT